MFFNRCHEQENFNMTGNINMGIGQNCCGCICEPVMECPQERVVNREMCYEVPQVCPFM